MQIKNQYCKIVISQMIVILDCSYSTLNSLVIMHLEYSRFILNFINTILSNIPISTPTQTSKEYLLKIKLKSEATINFLVSM